MSPVVVPPVGARIRRARTAQGMSLRGLAREIGVSASLISQIETGKSQPSVSTLYAITTALAVPVESLFDAAEDLAPGPGPALTPVAPMNSVDPVAVVAPTAPAAPVGAPAGTVLQALAAFAADPGHRIGPLVKGGEREVLELDSGVVWERLGRVPGAEVDFLLVTYRPGGASSGTGGLMRHSGTEYGYLTSGELVLTLGFDEYVIRPGDAVSFESSTPHRYRNDGAEPAVGVWFVFSMP
ncbi:helix-turn-helix domain-containing protein [Streptomyces sp. CWNU-52B]|uniref:helix-turn-helix domain-containing protein n=1 Tax=unclassified Streptomyces TaxID=2593676 RepID=UPI0039C1C864